MTAQMTEPSVAIPAPAAFASALVEARRCPPRPLPPSDRQLLVREARRLAGQGLTSRDIATVFRVDERGLAALLEGL